MTKLLTFAVLTLSLALPTQAQQRAGGTGHALDASRQVGSGGINAATPQTDYSLRNNVITGNVAGGSGFQGLTPYRAPGEFQGVLGSDSLFDFRTRSFYSASSQLNSATIPNINLATPGSPGSPGSAGVYRSYTNLAGQSFTGSSSRTIYSEGGSGRLTNPTRVGSESILTKSVQKEQIGGAANLNGVRTTAGQLLNVVASPLLGVRQLSTIQSQRTNTAEAQRRLEEQNRSLNQHLRIDTRLYQMAPPEAVEPDLTEQPTAAWLSNSPTRLLGRQLTAIRRTGDRHVELNAERRQQRAEKLRESIFSPKQVEGQSVYNALMVEVQQATPDTPDTPDTPGTPSTTWVVTHDFLEQPTDPSVKQAEETALEAIRRAYGLDKDDEDEQTSFKTVDESIAAIMKQLNYDLPALNTLAGQDATRTTGLMQDAEVAMLADDFFKAESAYRQVLLIVPGDPMARVGLTHAQLGAGMIRSSALNLRRLFEAHPELIAARYEARLLPNEERLRWVQGELHTMVERPDASADPGIMLAYLGYQINSRQLVRYGLALAQTSDPRDPLLPVLRQIWLDEQATLGEKNVPPSEAPEK